MMTPQEIREKILETVSQNGGHLASSLGAVELALAIYQTFDATKDRIVWDVGHQAYAWKILTSDGRKPFSTLRQLDGLAPFPLPAESKADAAVAGHAGVSISVAAGYAAARDLRKASNHVLAVVGDSALVNGTSLEALNNLVSATEKVIVVLNDNEMSISRPTGSLAKLLGRLITSVKYNRMKAAAEKTGHRLRLTFLRGIYHSVERRIKSWFLGNVFFEQFGLRYIGPVDGHDLSELNSALTVAKEDKRSVLVHVVTKKGKGFKSAENDPISWHGVSPFSLNDEQEPTKTAKEKTLSWSDAFGQALCDAAKKDERIVALTAGMKDGTGLTDFARAFPKRFYDVGIAEGHAVSFAAGLAAGGCRPVVAIYSTFLQRAVDQIMHDVCIADLPVVFCVDRAGIVGADGLTHQGLYDIALLRTFPNLTICQPKDAEDLKALLSEALMREGPTVIRYPRGVVSPIPVSPNVSCEIKKHLKHRYAVWATGDQLAKANEIAAQLSGTEVVFARTIKPFDKELLAGQRAEGLRIVSIENAALAGGFGEAIGADVRFGWPDVFIEHGPVAALEKRYGLDVASIVAAIQKFDTSTF